MLSVLRVALVPILLVASGSAYGQTEGIAEIATRGQKMRVLLTRPDKPIGSVILLAGKHGNLAISPDGKIGWGAGNQLVRTRGLYAKAGYVSATADIAPDLKQGKGVVPKYRWSSEHAADMGALVKHLRTMAQPVYLIGTSRGTISVANAAARLSGDEAPDAIVLTSGMLMNIDGRQPSAERNVGNLGRIKQPTLIIFHEKDQCKYTPASSAEPFRKLLTGAKRVDFKFLKGGSAQGDPCEGQHHHGFRGLDAEVVRVTTDWLKSTRD